MNVRDHRETKCTTAEPKEQSRLFKTPHDNAQREEEKSPKNWNPKKESSNWTQKQNGERQ